MSEEDMDKVIFLGEAGVGKTNLINITMGIAFNDQEAATASASFSTKKISVRGKDYTIKLWDTIGQEKFRTLTKLFYINAKIAIFVYDITQKDTFEEIKNYWVKDVEEKLGKDIIKGIVANKIDLFMKEQVTQEEGEEYAKSIGALFLSISAKADNPKKFEDFLSKLYEQYLIKNEANEAKLPLSKIQIKNKAIVLNKKKKNAGFSGKKCC